MDFASFVAGPRSPPLDPVNVDQDGNEEVDVLLEAGGVGRDDVNAISKSGLSNGDTIAK